ncbi:peptidyl-prolyl cis-trans isomerase G-like isoform X2 [Limulus polyphemus]|nr:peptidyl-prolyl cis-trans isomerase G-like isoform X2 [Limulus polyphemus]
MSGEEVVKEIENQKVDQDSRPLTDVVISNCGELVLKLKPKEKKKKTVDVSSVSSSGSESEDSDEVKSKKKKHKKHKKKSKHKKEKKQSKKESSKQKEEKKQKDDDYECSIQPEDIPEIPANRFLLRRTSPNPGPGDQRFLYQGEMRRYQRRPKISRSGRKIKGRGFMRYRTPSRSRSRSGSETPPHWKQAQARVKSLRENELANRIALEDDEAGQLEQSSTTDDDEGVRSGAGDASATQRLRSTAAANGIAVRKDYESESRRDRKDVNHEKADKIARTESTEGRSTLDKIPKDKKDGERIKERQRSRSRERNRDPSKDRYRKSEEKSQRDEKRSRQEKSDLLKREKKTRDRSERSGEDREFNDTKKNKEKYRDDSDKTGKRKSLEKDLNVKESHHREKRESNREARHQEKKDSNKESHHHDKRDSSKETHHQDKRESSKETHYKNKNKETYYEDKRGFSKDHLYQEKTDNIREARHQDKREISQETHQQNKRNSHREVYRQEKKVSSRESHHREKRERDDHLQEKNYPIENEREKKQNVSSKEINEKSTHLLVDVEKDNHNKETDTKDHGDIDESDHKTPEITQKEKTPVHNKSKDELSYDVEKNILIENTEPDSKIESPKLHDDQSDTEKPSLQEKGNENEGGVLSPELQEATEYNHKKNYADISKVPDSNVKNSSVETEAVTSFEIENLPEHKDSANDYSMVKSTREDQHQDDFSKEKCDKEENYISKEANKQTVEQEEHHTLESVFLPSDIPLPDMEPQKPPKEYTFPEPPKDISYQALSVDMQEKHIPKETVSKKLVTDQMKLKENVEDFSKREFLDPSAVELNETNASSEVENVSVQEEQDLKILPADKNLMSNLNEIPAVEKTEEKDVTVITGTPTPKESKSEHSSKQNKSKAVEDDTLTLHISPAEPETKDTGSHLENIPPPAFHIPLPEEGDSSVYQSSENVLVAESHKEIPEKENIQEEKLEFKPEDSDQHVRNKKTLFRERKNSSMKRKQEEKDQLVAVPEVVAAALVVVAVLIALEATKVLIRIRKKEKR